MSPLARFLYEIGGCFFGLFAMVMLVLGCFTADPVRRLTAFVSCLFTLHVCQVCNLRLHYVRRDEPRGVDPNGRESR